MRSIIFHRKGGKAKEDIHTQYFTLQGRKYNNVQNLKVYSHPLVFFPENLNLPPLISSFSPVLSFSLSLSLYFSYITSLFRFLACIHLQHSTRKKVIKKDKYSKASFHFSRLWTTYPIVDIFGRSTSKCKQSLSTISWWKEMAYSL